MINNRVPPIFPAVPVPRLKRERVRRLFGLPPQPMRKESTRIGRVPLTPPLPPLFG